MYDFRPVLILTVILFTVFGIWLLYECIRYRIEIKKIKESDKELDKKVGVQDNAAK
jgi:hypothetical protein